MRTAFALWLLWLVPTAVCAQLSAFRYDSARVPRPDEPGYRDGRLRLDHVETMTQREWAAYKRKRVGE